ncbi:50S ribosomal protein L19 [Candidatus Parcubacteria bacterium]|nr:50S ribosomal protein L19 [Candidatus Parcubacteria bacterium]
MSVIAAIEAKYKKPRIVNVKSGDSIRVHQKIREGAKERIQVFEGLVIRTKRKNSHTASITVRRVASGIGVEKTYLMHSPLITKVEVVKRSKVRRKYLSYMRTRTGKAARMTGIDFDKSAVNEIPEASQETKTETEKAEETVAVEKNDEDNTKAITDEANETKTEDKKKSVSEKTEKSKNA